MGALDHPAPRLIVGAAALVGFLISTQAANGLVAFVGAEPGDKIAFGRRGQHGQGIEHDLHLGDFVDVSPGDGHANGPEAPAGNSNSDSTTAHKAGEGKKSA